MAHAHHSHHEPASTGTSLLGASAPARLLIVAVAVVTIWAAALWAMAEVA